MTEVVFFWIKNELLPVFVIDVALLLWCMLLDFCICFVNARVVDAVETFALQVVTKLGVVRAVTFAEVGGICRRQCLKQGFC